MNFLKFTFIIGISLFSITAVANVSVESYSRKDGTYVQPHYRSNPDNNPYNNWSTKGNTNPYTGEKGTRKPNN
jgi:hypothetical protein